MIDASNSSRLDEMTRFAATLCGAEAALIIVDAPAGPYPASVFGLESADIDAVLPLCADAISCNDPVVRSAMEAGVAPGWRFFAAFPFAKGALCILGDGARPGLLPIEVDGLGFLARQAQWLIADRERLVRDRDLVGQELSHRIKNIFSVIAGLIGLSASTRPELAELVADLRDRVLALGRAHDFVRPESHRPAARTSLCGLLRQLFEPYSGTGDPRIEIEGDDPAIDDRSATPLALIFHELATNAAKYGALSHPQGKVILSIERDEAYWRLAWGEQGGTAIAAPAATGFGSQLIALSLERQLGGRIDREWRPEGLLAEIRIPADMMSRSGRPG